MKTLVLGADGRCHVLTSAPKVVKAGATVPASLRTYAVASEDMVILVDTALNSMAVVLPAASARTKTLTVKKTAAANDVIITPATNETVDGQPTHVLSVDNECVRLLSDDVGWWLV